MSTVALVLAAGASRRMGRPKALLPMGDGTFLSTVVAALRAGGADAVAVVVGGAHRAEIAAAVEALPGEVACLVNEDPSDGPVSSVRVGVAAFPGAEAFLVQPVDIPGITAEDVAALLAAAATEPAADAIVPSVAMRRGHPLLLRGARARLLSGEEGGAIASVRALLAEEGVRIHHVLRENRGLLRDVDTPEDYADLQRDASPPRESPADGDQSG